MDEPDRLILILSDRAGTRVDLRCALATAVHLFTARAGDLLLSFSNDGGQPRDKIEERTG